jgi:trk system potassium uptake protein TrkH
VGTIGYAVFEWANTLAELPVHHKLTNAWFSSVTARTAGFNTIPYGELGNDASFLTMALMSIGGSPGSTAGGVKTTTFAVLAALAWARILGQQLPEIRSRGVPRETLERTVSLVLLGILVLAAGFFALSAVTTGTAGRAEHAQFLSMSFEVVSAFSTVGLSMGTTETLNSGGKVVIIVLMFIGRVGLFSFFSAVLLRRGRQPVYRPALEDLQVG